MIFILHIAVRGLECSFGRRVVCLQRGWSGHVLNSDGSTCRVRVRVLTFEGAVFSHDLLEVLVRHDRYRLVGLLPCRLTAASDGWHDYGRLDLLLGTVVIGVGFIAFGPKFGMVLSVIFENFVWRTVRQRHGCQSEHNGYSL